MKVSRRESDRDARPVLLRLYEIDQMIRNGACPPAQKLAEKFEVSRRTIERDLEYLRDMCGAPIYYDRFCDVYRYSKEFSLNPLKLTEGELAVLLIGQRLLAEVAETPFAQAARQVMQKLPLLLNNEISIEDSALAKELSFGMPAIRGDKKVLSRHFNLLSGAIAAHYSVCMDYYTATRDSFTKARKIDPYHLRLEDGAWYLIGYCHLRQEPRIFALDRISNLVLLEEKFECPPDFSIEDFLAASWGIERGKEYAVKILFDAGEARWVKERVWQDGQVLTELPDGQVLLEVKVSGLRLIKRWVLGFGGRAKVLEPGELVEQIEREVQGMEEAYGFTR